MKSPAFAFAFAFATLAWGLTAGTAKADALLSDFVYPYPVERFDFVSQGQAVTMAYMDVAAASPSGKTAVLLHGKNFCGATFKSQIEALTGAGYRVIAPDQIGFCKSSKPMGYQYGFHQLAANTHALLAKLTVASPIVVGHSMGGMLAARYALMYGSETSGLVLVNPIGLEDWRAKGVPESTIDQLFAEEKQSSAESMKAYQQTTYYAGEWEPEYDVWVDMLASMYAGPGGEIVAWHQALTSDMIFNQPIVHEFGQLTVPTALLIGEKDNTAIGKNRAPAELKAQLGNYAVLGAEAAAAIPGATLVTFPELGHSPQVQNPGQFNASLLKSIDDFAKR
ncbi:hydrolase [Aureimonas sp. SA4125]|uniref:alpha/beta fold hydrolase n=1 Tax=Aureimonas sp. SA4125 TaxID=2826993 RepID=UPI001CC6D010|nr:alpha/beta hydrolase [Aureimonas sp. SA4125]BDA82719.1 hydrolase [Aureimonas sp. SA4125]